MRKLKLQNKVKSSFHVTKMRPKLQKWVAISQRLAIWYEGATPPRPDPGHLASTLSGVSKRVAVDTPVPNRTLIRGLKRYTQLWLRRNLKPLCPDQILSFEEWLEGTSYSSERKNDLRKTHLAMGARPSNKKLRRVKAFVKDETYPEYKFPRGIYSRADAAKCVFGPLVQAASDPLFSLPWFIKKIPVVDRPMAISNHLSKPGATYVYTDYTSFEAHFKETLMSACEHQFFNHMFSKLPAPYQHNIKLMAETKQGTNKIIFKLFNCKLDACRMSGEMDTSASNGFANLMLYLYASWLAGCPEENIVGFVEGDDGIFRNDGPMPTEADFLALGMTIKIGTTKKLERASFCGQVYDVTEGIVVTDVVEMVCRFGWTNKRYTHAGAAVRAELLRAKGYSLAYQYNGCPILGVLGRKILELTSKVIIRQSIIDAMDGWEKEKHFDAVNTQVPAREAGPNTRALVEELYGVTVNEQVEIEAAINSMTEMGPLPFKFNKVPIDWIHYVEIYGSDTAETTPFWIPRDEHGLISQLVAAHALLPKQAHQLLLGG